MAFDATVEMARRSEGADAPSSGQAKQALRPAGTPRPPTDHSASHQGHPDERSPPATAEPVDLFSDPAA